MIELAGAPDFPIASLASSANLIQGLSRPSTSKPYDIPITMATEKRLTARSQCSGFSTISRQHLMASLRCMSAYFPTRDLEKGGRSALR
jgi:hypothetical protein